MKERQKARIREGIQGRVEGGTASSARDRGGKGRARGGKGQEGMR